MSQMAHLHLHIHKDAQARASLALEQLHPTFCSTGKVGISRVLRVWQVNVSVEDDWKLLGKQLMEVRPIMSVHPVFPSPVVALGSTEKREDRILPESNSRRQSFWRLLHSSSASGSGVCAVLGSSSLTWWGKKARSVCLASVCWWRMCRGHHQPSPLTRRSAGTDKGHEWSHTHTDTHTHCN